MSNESKSKQVREWMIAGGVFVGIVAILATIWTTNKSIQTQQEVLERQSRIALAEAAYSGFLNDLLTSQELITSDDESTTLQKKPNTRIPIAIFGSKEVFQEFSNLQKAAGHKREPFQGSSELETALLNFLMAIRVDVLGESYAVDREMMKDILGMQ